MPLKSSLKPSPEPSRNDLSNEVKNTTKTKISGLKTSIGEDSDKKLKDTYVKTTVLSDIPSSTPYERQENLTKSSPESANIKDPIDEDVKPPPLAGANVMNVILVAAECAPWSKTGITISA